MRIMIRTVFLATASLCATAAFAANQTATVNIPFNFVSHGETYPAGKYVASLDQNHNVIALNNATNTRVSAHWIAGPADTNPNDEKLTLKFDDSGNNHYLQSVQLGPRITSRLDAPSRHQSAGSTEAAVNGQ